MSLISEAIAEITDNHQLDPTTDHCKADGWCQLKSGHEVAFVGLIADYLFQAIQERRRTRLKYHHWVYMPSRRAERLVGYDLSIGMYNNERSRRVRSMHKLLLRWCDNVQSWGLGPGKRDHEHLKALIEDYRASRAVRPYLVIHICYCIHDYRRMGLQHKGFQILDVDSLLRTIVVPIAELSAQAEQQMIPLEAVSLQYRRDTNKRLAAEDPQAYLERIADVSNHHMTVKIDGEPIMDLPILNLEQWRNETVEFLS
jgi:hypothetical protein